ncbi:hypothetical protein ACIG5E_26085 [Kitasatospora sp. NPDC053057]|uniref:hypothetical protein n=1 Tax=Kitasatospora sp. NPDC053057 TaxID=3364062 RepID=UPI0037CB975A
MTETEGLGGVVGDEDALQQRGQPSGEALVAAVTGHQERTPVEVDPQLGVSTTTEPRAPSSY